jgi:pyruvate/2-oxoglutarate dehydrogenase complex dihydrolipoamide acyltransferase (E2) component
LGQATEQAGQAAQEITQQTQDVAGGATQQAQGTAQQATQQDSAEQHEEATSRQQPQATSGASQKAEELGVDLSEVEGTGPDGRITLKDVKGAAKEQ